MYKHRHAAHLWCRFLYVECSGSGTSPIPSPGGSGCFVWPALQSAFFPLQFFRLKPQRVTRGLRPGLPQKLPGICQRRWGNEAKTCERQIPIAVKHARIHTPVGRNFRAGFLQSMEGTRNKKIVTSGKISWKHFHRRVARRIHGPALRFAGGEVFSCAPRGPASFLR